MPAYGGSKFHSSYTNWNFKANRNSISEKRSLGSLSGNVSKMRSTMTGFKGLQNSSQEDHDLYNALNNLNIRRINNRKRANIKILDRKAESDDDEPELFIA